MIAAQRAARQRGARMDRMNGVRSQLEMIIISIVA
jgi:hypothetical protein